MDHQLALLFPGGTWRELRHGTGGRPAGASLAAGHGRHTFSRLHGRHIALHAVLLHEIIRDALAPPAGIHAVIGVLKGSVVPVRPELVQNLHIQRCRMQILKTPHEILDGGSGLQILHSCSELLHRRKELVIIFVHPPHLPNSTQEQLGT